MSSNIRITRICLHCGNEFTAKTTVTKFCGDYCSKRNYKKRKREGKIADSNTETVARQTEPITARQAEVRAKEFLSVKDACVLVGVSRWTLARAIKDGQLNAVRFGRRVVLKRGDVDRLFS
jgi:excisionase family DNA binding protein